MQTADLRNRDFENILLIKLSALGDVVHTLPVVTALRARYPKARIDWLVATEFTELVLTTPAPANAEDLKYRIKSSINANFP